MGPNNALKGSLKIDPKKNAQGELPEGPGEGQGEGQENQGTLKQLGRGPLSSFHLHLVLLAFPLALP